MIQVVRICRAFVFLEPRRVAAQSFAKLGLRARSSFAWRAAQHRSRSLDCFAARHAPLTFDVYATARAEHHVHSRSRSIHRSRTACRSRKEGNGRALRQSCVGFIHCRWFGAPGLLSSALRNVSNGGLRDPCAQAGSHFKCRAKVRSHYLLKHLRAHPVFTRAIRIFPRLLKFRMH